MNKEVEFVDKIKKIYSSLCINEKALLMAMMADDGVIEEIKNKLNEYETWLVREKGGVTRQTVYDFLSQKYAPSNPHIKTFFAFSKVYLDIVTNPSEYELARKDRKDKILSGKEKKPK